MQGDMFAPRWTAWAERCYQQMIDAERTIERFPKYYRACARNFHLTGCTESDRPSEPTTGVTNQ